LTLPAGSIEFAAVTDPANETVASEPERPFDLEKAAPLLLALLVLVVFAPLVRYEFQVWDDHDTIARNPLFNPVTGESYVRFWTTPHMDMYAPLTYTVWGLVATVARVQTADPQGITLNPMIFHGLNILLHAAAAVMVMQILRALMPGAVWAPLIGAAVWAVHPVQVEPVAWISGGKDVLSGLLGLAALWLYLLYARGVSAGDLSQRPIVWFVVATVLFVLAMLAKPSAVVLPVIAAALDVLVLRRPARQIIGPLIIWLALCVPIVVIGYITQEHARHVVSPAWFRPVVALDALAFYVRKLLIPWALVPDYGRSPLWLMNSPERYWTWVVPVVVAAACYVLRARVPALLAGFLVLVAAVSPVLGLIRFDFQIYSSVADHYLYVALLGGALVVAAVLARRDLPAEPASGALRDRGLQVALVVVAVLAIRSFVQTWHWRDSPTLFSHTLAVNPHSVAGHNILGLHYAEQARVARAAADEAAMQGDAALSERVQQQAAEFDQAALEHYLHSLSVRPRDPVVHLNVANGYARVGQLDKAIEHYEFAIEQRPEEARFRSAYGSTLLENGSYEAAVEQYNAVLELTPDDAVARVNLGAALTGTGNYAAAREQYLAALRLAPDFAVAQRNLARLDALEKSPPPPAPPAVPPEAPAPQ
jgi:protein O-mannosyl-transferase